MLCTAPFCASTVLKRVAVSWRPWSECTTSPAARRHTGLGLGSRLAHQGFGHELAQAPAHDFARVAVQLRNQAEPAAAVVPGRANTYDNALPGTTQAESLWSRLKTKMSELREWPVFADLADAQASIADYFDCYNHDRLHSSIGYQTPYHAHQQLLQTTVLNCPA